MTATDSPTTDETTSVSATDPTTSVDPDSSSTAAVDESSSEGSSSSGEPNLDPEPVDDFYLTHTAAEMLAVDAAVGLLVNDADPEDDPLTVGDFDATSEAGGTVVVQADGSFTYEPPDPFWGEDAFSYTLDDGAGGSAVARVRVAVAPTVEDLEDLGVATAGHRVEPAASGDHIAVSVAGGGDVDGDGHADVVMGADDALADDRGAAYVVLGGPAPGTASAADLENGDGGFAILGPSAADSTGFSVAMLGDVNGDGLADVGVGTTDGSTGSVAEVYVVFGTSSNASIDLDALGDGGFMITGGGDPSFGISIGGAGDVDGDGLADIIVGSPDAGAGELGAATVIFGKADTSSVDATAPGGAGFRIEGTGTNGHLGWSVAGAGDMNLDGLDDVIVGAPDADSGAGRVFVVFGKNDTDTVSEDDLAAGTGGGFMVSGGVSLDQMGYSVAGVRDCDGDGRPDVMFGATGAESGKLNASGRAYVVLGKASSTAVTVADLEADSGGFVLEGEADFDFAGWSVGGAGDVDGDGLADLLVGAQGADFAAGTAGRTYVIYGRAAPVSRSLADVATGLGGDGFVLDGEGFLHTAGWSVHGSGDTNGDGFADLTLGAPRAVSSSGWGYVAYGGNYTGRAVLAATSDDDVLTGTAEAETLVGGRGADEIVTMGGADVVLGGAGDDVVSISTLDFFRLDGGLGEDTLRLEGDGFSLDFSNFFDVAIVGFEVVDLGGRGDNGLFMDLRDLRVLSSSSNTLRVVGDAGDQLVADLTGGGLLDEGSDGEFTTYSNGVLTLIVDDDLDAFVSLDP